jgi:hypothetical protein
MGIVEASWAEFLRYAVDDYRQKYPDDPRSDFELAQDFCEYLVDEGVIRKRHGKFILPGIVAGKPVRRVRRAGLRQFSKSFGMIRSIGNSG